MTTYKNLIGRKWTNSESGKTFKSVNPATGKSLGDFQLSTGKDVDRAVKAAQKAYPKWSRTPAPKRGEILLKIADLLKENKKRLAKLETREMGKVLNEARGDVQEAIDIAEYMAGEGRRMFGHSTPSELPEKAAWTVRRSVGVFGVIAPWNFPIAIPAWKLMPCLVCGNTAVFKPSSDTPLCGIEFVKIIREAGVPPGVINLVTGPGGTVGKRLIEHPDVRGISFTGHRDTGKFITEHAGLKKVGLELGGKNGIIIMDDADLELALDGVVWGAFGTTGQRCTAASRVIIQKGVKARFEKMLLKRVKKLKLGSGLDSKTDIGPLVNRAAQEKSQKYVEIGKKEGAKLCCGGKPGKGRGFFFRPTVFTNCSPDMRICQEEIFGPILSIIPVKDLNQAIKVMNGIEYGLSSAIYTKDVNKAFKAIEGIEAGLTYVNSSTIGSEVHLPFGGVKHTGNGTREAGIEGIEEFTETKTVYVDYSGKLQKAQKIE